MAESDDHKTRRQQQTASDTTSPQVNCCRDADPCEPADPSRRQFIKLAGAATASLAATGGLPRAAETTDAKVAPDHFVPLDKKLDPKWLKSLTAKGQPTFYRGGDLDRIAMPVGGICAGQLYLTGDGRLVHWDLFNIRNFSGYGGACYDLNRIATSPLKQGFALRVTAGGKTTVRSLDREGFPGVRFCGEYPIATVQYQDKQVPVSVTLEAFSPFIPLNAADSALPATLMQFTLKNDSSEAAEVTLAGWLENGTCIKSGGEASGVRFSGFNRCFRDATVLWFGAKETKSPEAPRPPKLLADFEAEDYGDWTVEGDAFGTGPAKGTLDKQQEVSGYQGERLVNTYLGGSDEKTGKLSSPTFTIERKFLSFLIGGGNQAGKTCINLLVDGKVVRTAVGKQEEKLLPHNWDVDEFQGKQAKIEIVDAESGPWGHVNIDQIELRDTPRTEGGGPLRERADYGTMGLAVLGEKEGLVGWASLPEGKPQDVLFQSEPAALYSPFTKEEEQAFPPRAEKPLHQPLVGAIGKRMKLEAGQEKKVVFAVTWCFPNRPQRGNYYATKLGHAVQVAHYLAKELDRLDNETRLWHKTWYDSTLPHWLLDRLFSTVSTLATSTCQWWKNGRFWAWEGVGCCHGTCSHVWNYEHAMARLFPELERSVREMQDYHPEAGFVEETGMVRFRGEGWGMWAGDGQAGTVLKAYREHQTAGDDEFLKRNWTRIRKSLEFLINEDRGNGSLVDGVIEGSQHNTYDINFFGANTMVGSLYLAALRAGEEMAREVGDSEFAATCHKLFASGSKLSVEKLFNGEYFIQDVDLEKHPKAQYGQGCLADQLFGQGWACQVGLGYIYPEENVQTTLRSIWKYNWAPDIGPQNKVHKPERWFASPGEPGLFTCTWPHTPHLPEGVRYKNEIWTGIEYQVAGNMAWEGMITEALAICRSIHDRYHPSKHNPFNEVECGDHYARAMASHGVFLGLCGFEYHGPKAHFGFAPRITPDDFRAAFTAAEGWGTLAQKRTGKAQKNRIEVKWGELRLKSLAFELPEGAKLKTAQVTFMGNSIQASAKQDGRRVVVTLAVPAVVEKDQAIDVELTL